MKSGFAVLIGRSNVGKSTLLNALVGRKLSIVTNIPQTTRGVIHGVREDGRGQIIFVDTPGVLKGSHGALTGVLLKKVEESLRDIDVILYVVDPTRSVGGEERYILSLLRMARVPIILVLNKMDMRNRPYRDAYLELEPDLFTHIIEVSAAENTHISTLVDTVFEALPEGEPLYEAGTTTNLTKEQWVAELIREKVLHVSRDELPYETHVVVDEIEQRADMFIIRARILVSADRYKKMMIGHGGRTIKEVGTVARKELEQILNQKIFLELEVETDRHLVTRI